ncbi:MAG TPA: YifB family Mg chelatase-like AAA ATPase [Segeticoccus sp.]|nr:YifB family Mg chelatase-like AAA ATPase [Segeticoccus sp.]
MTLGRTRAVALIGITGAVVDVEADVGSGLPAFNVSGLPDTACLQSPDRIKAAAGNSGVDIRRHRTTVNLSPASLPKSGSGFDLPIAVAVLAAAGHLPQDRVGDVVHLGELGLDGSVRPVPGILPAVLAASRDGFREVVVPEANLAEARLAPGVRVHGAADLVGLIARYTGSAPPPEQDRAAEPPTPVTSLGESLPDLRDVAGQTEARLALEIAAAGRHHMCMVGAPGAGKTMLAERLPGLLPPLEPQEALEVTAIHSVLGDFRRASAMVRRPPFEAPHHGASMAAMVGGGGGRLIRPGAVSRAHHGVLFLDETPEFRRDVLEALRQPVERGCVVVARAEQVVQYPARFQLVLAANPCPCGHGYGKGVDCSCSPSALRRYRSKLGGPLLDRVDLQLEVRPVSRTDLAAGPGEPSRAVAARVASARQRQADRLRGTPWSVNGDVPGAELREGDLRLPRRTTADLDRALERGLLSLRGYDRVLRLAWTLADLGKRDRPGVEEVGRALALRTRGVRAA